MEAASDDAEASVGREAETSDEREEEAEEDEEEEEEGAEAVGGSEDGETVDVGDMCEEEDEDEDEDDDDGAVVWAVVETATASGTVAMP